MSPHEWFATFIIAGETATVLLLLRVCSRWQTLFDEEHEKLRKAQDERAAALAALRMARYELAAVADERDKLAAAFPPAPAGCEPYRPEFVAAMAETCDTPKSRQGKTQDEVFEAEKLDPKPGGYMGRTMRSLEKKP